MVGRGAMTNSIEELAGSKLILVTGSNTTETHPVISLRMKKAVKNGAKLIVVDPRKIELTKWADKYIQIRIGTDIPFYNAVSNYIIQNNLYDKDYVATRTRNFEEIKDHLTMYTPEYSAKICGIDPEDIIYTAKEYAKASPKAAICYTVGITEHSCGSYNVQSLANLAMVCGNFGSENAGVNPLRGQNNVQGVSDSGSLPTDLPGYQKLEAPGMVEKFEKIWDSELPRKRGMTKITAMDKMNSGDVKFLFVMGENTIVSDPNANHAIHALENLDFFVVQDIFMTQTAKMADLVLPASSFAEANGTFVNTERRVQRVRPAISTPGNAKTDVDIILGFFESMGKKHKISEPSEIWKEMASTSPLFKGITYERIETEGGIQWPCPDEKHPGTKYLHKDQMESGETGIFSPVDHIEPAEQTDDEYPFVLSTGRRRSTYHTGTQTGKAKGFDQIISEELVEINPFDAKNLSIKDKDLLKVESRRGSVKVKAKITDKSPEGAVFMSFAFPDKTMTNNLTSDAVDFITETPEYKACAVKISVANK